MGGQPGKPKPPGNPPVRPEPQEPEPMPKRIGGYFAGLSAERQLGRHSINVS